MGSVSVGAVWPIRKVRVPALAAGTPPYTIAISIHVPVCGLVHGKAK